MDAQREAGAPRRRRVFWVAGGAGLVLLAVVLTLFVLRARGPAAEDCEDPKPPASQFEVAGCEAGAAPSSKP